MIERYDFDTSISRRDTNCVKWDRVEPDVLPLWVADMDFLAPPVVTRALKETIDHGIFGYPFFGSQVQEAVTEWMAKRHGWQVDPAHVVLIPGVVTGFNFAAYAVSQPGDGVLVQTPAYGPFLHVAENYGFVDQRIAFPQDENGRYYVDLDAFEAAITPKTRIFMLCNPHNPTGRVFTRRELERMAEICLENNVLICADEIHSIPGIPTSPWHRWMIGLPSIPSPWWHPTRHLTSLVCGLPPPLSRMKNYARSS
ncbi:MAG: aminotransferase class I/II-fold pyridoxal phosphate-dependent enzyme [Anaerolineales bacterium]|jgi:cystathionine beta-lyase